jgi:AraC-like DNA-binding protein
MDPLSDVLLLIRVNSILSGCLEGAGRWNLRFPAYQHLIFGDMHEGIRWLWIENVTEPLKLEPGDFYLLTNGQPYYLATDLSAEVVDWTIGGSRCLGPDSIVRYGEGGTRTVSTGARFLLDDETSDMLLDFLPPLIHICASSPHTKSLRSALDLIGYENKLIRLGAAAIAGGLANIMLVNILRTYLAGDSRPIGWLGALTDSQIGYALGLMHKQIARKWKVDDLASKVGMSRTAFVERFKALVGMPPLEYLIRWRMTVARNALKTENENLATIAASVGYASEAAFSVAFTKTFGKSPGRYRLQARPAKGSSGDRGTSVRKLPSI